jgi:hypothetical protein
MCDRASGTVTHAVGYDGIDYFDGLQERESLRVEHRITIRVFRLEDGQKVRHGQMVSRGPGKRGDVDQRGHRLFPFNVESGTFKQWGFPVQAVFCFDDYPADYPEAVSDPELRDAAQRTLSPGHVVFGSVQGAPAGGAFFVRLMYSWDGVRSAVPLAGELDLLASGSEEVLASAPLRLLGKPDGYGEIGVSMSFADGASQARQRFLLLLAQGDVQEVRLVLRPSRAVALRGNPMSRYWAEPVDVTVPVRYAGR